MNYSNMVLYGAGYGGQQARKELIEYVTRENSICPRYQ